MSPFGPAIKAAAYLGVILAFGCMVLTAIIESWWLFGSCFIVSLVGVKAVAKIWAVEQFVPKTESQSNDFKSLLAELEDTARRVPQQEL